MYLRRRAVRPPSTKSNAGLDDARSQPAFTAITNNSTSTTVDVALCAASNPTTCSRVAVRGSIVDAASPTRQIINRRLTGNSSGACARSRRDTSSIVVAGSSNANRPPTRRPDAVSTVTRNPLCFVGAQRSIASSSSGRCSRHFASNVFACGQNDVNHFANVRCNGCPPRLSAGSTRPPPPASSDNRSTCCLGLLCGSICERWFCLILTKPSLVAHRHRRTTGQDAACWSGWILSGADWGFLGCLFYSQRTVDHCCGTGCCVRRTQEIVARALFSCFISEPAQALGAQNATCRTPSAHTVLEDVRTDVRPRVYCNITLLQNANNCAPHARSQTTDITDHHHHHLYEGHCLQLMLHQTPLPYCHQTTTLVHSC